MQVLKQEIEGNTCITLVFDNTQDDYAMYAALTCMVCRDISIPKIVEEYSGNEMYKPTQRLLGQIQRGLDGT